MRICSVLLENLNSLVGTWSVDFRSSAYEESGLFAITGPTGAGKSTLLDALCLGLYGRTPRLENISKSTNEVMSRQKGVCRAEVVFEVSRGTFRASWGQHRANKKWKGALQQPWRELADAISGEILESSVGGVNFLVEELTGMDFHRFTRSVLLAQGGFASFLRASPNEKAPLLEQITGTDLYSRFSVYVHERRRREQEALRDIESRSEGVELLSSEELRSLKEEHRQALKAEGELELRDKELFRGKEWRAALERLERELREAERERILLEERRKDAEEDLRKLRRGQMALTLEAKYEFLESTRRNRNELAQRGASLEKEIEVLEELAERLRREEKEAEARSDKARKDREEKRPILEECLRREEELRVLEEGRGEASELLKKKNLLREKQGEELRILEEEHEKTRERLEEYVLFFEEHGEDASLGETCGLLREKWEQFRERESRERILGKEKILEEEKLEAKRKEEENLASVVEELRRKGQNREDLRKGERKKLEGLLEGEEVSAWRSREERCRINLRWTVETAELLEKLGALEKEQARLRKEEEVQERRKGEILGELEHAEKLLVQIAERCAGQEKLLHLSLRVASLEEERSRLRSGIPCPLCGSPEHPYEKKEKLPVREREQEELERIREEQRRQEKDRGVLERELAFLESRLEDRKRERQGIEESLKSAKGRMENLRREVPSSEEEKDLSSPEDFEKSLKELEREENSLKERLKRIEDLRKALEDLEKRERVENRELQEREKSMSSLTFAVEESEREIARRKRELEELKEELRLLEENLRSLLAPYEKISREEPLEERYFEDLQIRWNAWKKRSAEAEEEKLRFRGLQERREGLKAQEFRMEEELKGLWQDLQRKENFLEEKRGERRSLYEGDPRKGLEDLEENFERTRKEHQDLVSERKELSGKREVLEASRKEGEKALEEAVRLEALRGEEFSKALEKNSFADEGDFLKARISEELREKLTLLQEELERKEAELKGRLARGIEALKAEEEKKVTSLSAEELEVEQRNCGDALRELRRKIGILKAKEEEQETLSKKAEELCREAEARKKILWEWEELHSLVGSADGKKFRNFVQGLTFEMLVRQANRQLERMTDRYLLIQNPEEPLEFCVCDSYQGGEIRSSKNLSGGESFLVSLALALGLSRMIGGKNRVESLFLDEGFGSLDEDTLEVALQALGELQGTCRLVGVISHVPALSERMANQIRVIPVTGGRSRLEGPGVSGGMNA